MRAIVIGGGIGGLSAAIALRRAGWQVEVRERADAFRPAGAGITLQANALAGLEALGVGDAVRALGRVDAAGGTRTRDGRWLSRIDGDLLEEALGTGALAVHRADLHRILLAALPPEAVHTGSPVSAVPDADLVVAADGIDSTIRRLLFPDSPAPVYQGSTAWRGVTDEPWPGEPAAARGPGEPWRGEPVTSITWDRGAEFGIVPLGDGRAYWFGAVNAPEGVRHPDERAEVLRLFGGWHEPIADLVRASSVVLHHDLRHLARPLPSYVRGNVALLGDAAHAMTPNLGQGGAQAIEDAVVLGACCGRGRPVAEALAAYDAERRPRAEAVAAASLRIGRFGQRLTNPVLIAARNAAMRLTPPRVALRSMARYAAWQPPAP